MCLTDPKVYRDLSLPVHKVLEHRSTPLAEFKVAAAAGVSDGGRSGAAAAASAARAASASARLNSNAVSSDGLNRTEPAATVSAAVSASASSIADGEGAPPTPCPSFRPSFSCVVTAAAKSFCNAGVLGAQWYSCGSCSLRYVAWIGYSLNTQPLLVCHLDA